MLGRPFKTRDDMVWSLIENHNELVDENDLTYFLGDICWGKAPDYLKYVGKMSGRKILLRGNHDRVFTDEELLEYFDKVYPEGVGVEIESFGNKYLLNHYPTLGVITF